ncbi:enoyl-CoA hydratase/isomerase family protein [Gallaecimonas mangrovi]|uniref:enoyl-CoA hydratase/isomerase family protein n=1 Tax=Gallaecimonas mangrovi TaxID=2291597 RepID=UPI003AF32E58
MVSEYKTLRIRRDGGISHVTLDSPPVNVLGVQMFADLHDYLTKVREDETLKVIIFDSAVPDFFIAHVDMSLIDQPQAFDALLALAPEGLNIFQALGEMLRHQPQVTIVKLEGQARGGGAEFVAAADMCFAAIGKAGLSQCEALMGIVPGGGGTQYLAQKMTRNRALEVVLGADVIDAETAAAWGWINRALPPETLTEHVERIAKNIANLADGVISAAKSALPAADLASGMLTEHAAWAGLFSRPAAAELIRGGLRLGAQTPGGEAQLETIMRSLKPTVR